MGRLIDADREIAIREEEIEKYNRRAKHYEEYMEPDNINIISRINQCRSNITQLQIEIMLINAMQTAYDLDNKMKQLEELRFELLQSTDYESEIINYCLDWMDKAIEIVKGGK